MSSSAPIRNLNDFSEIPGLTREVAHFATDTASADLPPALLDVSRKSILDGIGLALAGSVADSGALVNAYLRKFEGCSEATVIGTALRVPTRFAAFANGVAIHADDYDDTQLASGKDRVYGLLTHPTAPSLPAVLATAEVLHASGRDVMAAYNIGVEVECKIAEAINPRHYQQGFHSTGTCGPFAAAAAVARLKGLNPAQTAQALAIAGSQSAGLRENFGTMTKPFHAGRAAESGVVAADFAAMGWTATDKILEAGRGFFRAAGGGFDPRAISGKLGDPWTFLDPGVSIKPFPSGSLTHPGMTKFLELVLEHDIEPEEVESIDVGTNQHMPNALIHHRPTTHLQAKFSMEFCMAILLLERRAGLPQFTDQVVNRPDVKAWIERVNFRVHPDAEAAGYDKMTTILDIRMKNGRHIRGVADFGKGSPQHPMSYDEVADKFRGCAEFARWESRRIEGIIEVVRHLEVLDDVCTLLALCRGPAGEIRE
jgi:2-methylcitrate dehydratase PrpD